MSAQRHRDRPHRRFDRRGRARHGPVFRWAPGQPDDGGALVSDCDPAHRNDLGHRRSDHGIRPGGPLLQLLLPASGGNPHDRRSAELGGVCRVPGDRRHRQSTVWPGGEVDAAEGGRPERSRHTSAGAFLLPPWGVGLRRDRASYCQIFSCSRSAFTIGAPTPLSRPDGNTRRRDQA